MSTLIKGSLNSLCRNDKNLFIAIGIPMLTLCGHLSNEILHKADIRVAQEKFVPICTY